LKFDFLWIPPQTQREGGAYSARPESLAVSEGPYITSKGREKKRMGGEREVRKRK